MSRVNSLSSEMPTTLRQSLIGAMIKGAPDTHHLTSCGSGTLRLETVHQREVAEAWLPGNPHAECGCFCPREDGCLEIFFATRPRRVASCQAIVDALDAGAALRAAGNDRWAGGIRQEVENLGLVEPRSVGRAKPERHNRGKTSLRGHERLGFDARAESSSERSEYHRLGASRVASHGYISRR